MLERIKTVIGAQNDAAKYYSYFFSELILLYSFSASGYFMIFPVDAWAKNYTLILNTLISC